MTIQPATFSIGIISRKLSVSFSGLNFSSNVPLPEGQWSHIAVVYDGLAGNLFFLFFFSTDVALACINRFLSTSMEWALISQASLLDLRQVIRYFLGAAVVSAGLTDWSMN